MKVSQGGEQIKHDLPRRGGRSPGRKLVNRSPVRDGHRFLSSADAATRAQVVGGLQGSLGNAAVQRLAASEREPAVQRAPQKGSEPVVQRALELKFESKDITNPVVAESFNWGAKTGGGGGAMGGGGAIGGADKLEMSDVSFTKKGDKNTVGLYKAFFEGSHIPKVEVDFSRTETSGGVKSKKPVLGFVFHDTLVSSMSTSGSEEPFDNVSLNFQKIETKSPDTPEGKGTKMEYDRSVAERK